MSRVERFEDLIAWQKARALTVAVYRASATGPLATDFALRQQLRKAAISVPANIAEGFERNRSREFHQFLSVAKASCAEVRTYLYLACDLGFIEERDRAALLDQAAETARVIGGLRRSVAKKLSTQHPALSTRAC